jgi:hypothetical protein
VLGTEMPIPPNFGDLFGQGFFTEFAQRHVPLDTEAAAAPEGPSIGEVLWTLRHYWGDEFVDGERRRKKKRHVLGPATMGRREAEKIRDEFLRPLNQGLVSIGSATKFEDFVETVYKPVVLPTMAKSTRDRSLSVYGKHLKPQFPEISPCVVLATTQE